jgi:hypothetical protein
MGEGSVLLEVGEAGIVVLPRGVVGDAMLLPPRAGILIVSGVCGLVLGVEPDTVCFLFLMGVVSRSGGERVREGSTTPAKCTGVGSWIMGSSMVVLRGVDCGDPSGVIMSSALRVRDAGCE